jgi:thiamine biosynthesis lipoprotein
MLVSSAFRCMTTEIELFIDVKDAPVAREALQAAQSFFEGVEARFSRFRPDSELSRLNNTPGKPVRVSPDLAELVGLALSAARDSDGIFDPTVIDALEAAGYDRSIELIRADGPHAPRKVVPHVGRWKEIVIDKKQSTVYLPVGVRLDLGGIGKGWAADRVATMLQPLGPGMVNAGGDIRAWGDQPALQAKQGWLVTVDHPQQPGTDIAWLHVRDGAVATSSITARRWAGGHHLIDPSTAQPADTDLWSVTALAPSAAQAEVAAKVALILGREAGLKWLVAQHDVVAMAIDNTGELYGTEGIEEALL